MFRRVSALFIPSVIGASLIMVPPRVDAQSTVLVPGGTFQMGDPFNEGNADDESPVHDVWVSPFSIDKYEVTNAFYAQFLNAGGNDTHWEIRQRIARTGSPGSYVYTPTAGFETHPVVYVSWDDAVAFCNWRSQAEGLPPGTYRLPTEAEWEKAAGWNPDQQRHYRFGEGTDGCGTNCLDGNRANYLNSGDPFESTRTTPVGYYDGSTHGVYTTQDAKSYYGAYDMSGNLWEWVSDWYSPTYYGTSPSVDPTGPTSGTYRVVRGGNWADIPSYVRSADRNYTAQDNHAENYGIRCVAGGERVPAVSIWGLGILGLLVLTAGTAVAMKRAVRASR